MGEIHQLRNGQMAISVQCACGQKYNVKDELAGKKLKCKKCGEGMRVPTPQRKPPSDDEFGFDDPWSSEEPMQPPPARVRIKKQKIAAAKSSASSSGGTTLDGRIAARGAEAANADRRSWKRPMIVLFWGIFYVAIGYFSFVLLTDYENYKYWAVTRFAM